ncbi:MULTISPECIES: CPBP family glutamic-type intramembrane protease [Chryseobacterium]|uniref:CPBP family glutamic-type intramembrane protease n=1 Tax=Chryseobacterium TaxID=59732 RepID=UPI0031D871CD
MITNIKNLFYFYFAPSKEITSTLSLRSKVISIFVFLLLQYLLLLLITSIRYILVLKNVLPPLNHDDETSAIVNSLFFSVFLGPLLEEVIFRLWIVYNKINISFSATYLLLWLFGTLFHVYWFKTLTSILLFALIFSLTFTVLFFLLKKYENQKLINFWQKNQKALIIISCILFTVIHIGNYIDNNNSIAYYFITFAPQISFGFILCYIRIRMGFGASVATHSINNFIPLILSKII